MSLSNIGLYRFLTEDAGDCKEPVPVTKYDKRTVPCHSYVKFYSKTLF